MTALLSSNILAMDEEDITNSLQKIGLSTDEAKISNIHDYIVTKSNLEEEIMAILQNNNQVVILKLKSYDISDNIASALENILTSNSSLRFLILDEQCKIPKDSYATIANALEKAQLEGLNLACPISVEDCSVILKSLHYNTSLKTINFSRINFKTAEAYKNLTDEIIVLIQENKNIRKMTFPVSLHNCRFVREPIYPNCWQNYKTIQIHLKFRKHHHKVLLLLLLDESPFWYVPKEILFEITKDLVAIKVGRSIFLD
jgi:hypothetical protein